MSLQRVLGLSSYQTAWAMLHRLRRAMVRPGRERLGGAVEVDETYVGGAGRGSHGRGSDAGARHWRNNTAKAVVAIKVGVHEPKGLWRVRLCRLDEFTFRFNRRTSRSRGLLFYRLLEGAVVTNPVTYHDIVANKR